MIRRERDLKWLHEWRNKEVVKIISGVRRCGKSTLLRQYQQDLLNEGVPESRILFLNFESMDHVALRSAVVLHQYVNNHFKDQHEPCHVLLDEIQIVDNWEEAINSLRLDQRFDITITGSNATLLASELSTRLSGRYVQMMLFPFSLAEARQMNPELTMDEYLRFGGFPGVLSLETERMKRVWLSDLTDSILFRDIMLRGDVANPIVLRNLCSFLFDNVGNRYSIRKIANTLRSRSSEPAKQETISKYIRNLEEAYLLYEAQRYDLQGKAILGREPKYYVVDPGIRTVLTSSESRNIGFVLENMVYLELRRRGYQVYIGKEDDLEIDFVAELEGKRMYIQVALTLLDERTAEREFKPLMEVRDNFPKFVLSLDQLDMSRSGIRHLSAESFLMGDL